MRARSVYSVARSRSCYRREKRNGAGCERCTDLQREGERVMQGGGGGERGERGEGGKGRAEEEEEESENGVGWTGVAGGG